MMRMATKRKNKKAKFRILVFLPICLVILGAIFVMIGNYWVKIYQKYQEKSINFVFFIEIAPNNLHLFQGRKT